MARRKEPVIPDAILDQLLAGSDAKSAFDSNGLIDQLKKALGLTGAECGDGSPSFERRRKRQQPQRLWKKTVLTDDGSLEGRFKRSSRHSNG